METTHQGFNTNHEGMIHDAQMDYYGKKLATCSSDRTIKIFQIDGDQQTHVADIRGHEGAIWQVAWAHPKFGNILASCSYDRKVIIWKETSENTWTRLYDHVEHESSVNSISWAPHEYGPILACASSDSSVSVITCNPDDTWSSQKWHAHQIGYASSGGPFVTIRDWCSADPGSLNDIFALQPIKRLATGGCDNLVKIWRYLEVEKSWQLEDTLEAHTDWVRDVSWAPGTGTPGNTIASCGQDHLAIVWTRDGDSGPWVKTTLPKFADTVWRVSWSISGNILAVSCGDQHVRLYKETLEGDWRMISDMNDAAPTGQPA